VSGRPIEIWFQDEARVGQQGSLEYIWAPIGSRPRAVRDNRHDSVYIFGALCPARATGSAIIMPAANAEAMGKHLKDISVMIAPGAHGVILCDGAGWHHRGKKLRVPANITLLPFPSYCPELNSMENVWDYLRGNKLSHCVWNSYDEMVGACAEAWNFLIEDPARIRSIAHRAWACVND
jgi:putative transposase